MTQQQQDWYLNYRFKLVTGGGGSHMLGIHHVTVNRPPFLSCHLPDDLLFKLSNVTGQHNLTQMTPVFDSFYPMTPYFGCILLLDLRGVTRIVACTPCATATFQKHRKHGFYSWLKWHPKHVMGGGAMGQFWHPKQWLFFLCQNSYCKEYCVISPGILYRKQGSLFSSYPMKG